ncbi:MAG TPA: alpha/beta hydrolase [Candidatus Limnocylindrales bacterium]|nr:alpha/beta hydrolase [Candidatus Limnocylindrales bacterium]
MSEPTHLTMADGRLIEAWIEGPADARRTLVFHNGTPSSGLPYGPDLDALGARGIRWVSWSRPGYGDSTRQEGRSVGSVVADARAIFDQLGIERAYVAGWSGGGPHALACAALMPERVIASAVLAGVAPYPAEGLDYLAGMGAENVEEFNAALDGPEALIGFKERNWPIFSRVTGEEIAAAFGDLVDDVDRGSIKAAFAEYLAAAFRGALRPGYWGWYDDDMAFVKPWGFDLGSITGRVHVWQGAHDRMVPFGHGQWLAAHIPGAIPHLLPEHGHLTLVVDSFPRILDELLATPA